MFYLQFGPLVDYSDQQHQALYLVVINCFYKSETDDKNGTSKVMEDIGADVWLNVVGGHFTIV